MLCINPFRPRKGVEYGCGQCRCCRINRSRTWTGRILLEAACFEANTFATLTYSPDHLPEFGSLSDDHWREVTKAIGFRYFGVGEYGDRHGRAHYHLILFGIDALAALTLLQARWPYGFVQCLPLESRLAAYVARYTTKKYLNRRDLDPGQTPEFQRMSRRPAIGSLGISTICEWLSTSNGSRFISKNKDVPQVIRHEGSIYPLGRTLVLRLRAAAGIPTALPFEIQEERRLQKVADLEYPEVKALLEAKRQKHYDHVTAKVTRLKGSL